GNKSSTLPRTPWPQFGCRIVGTKSARAFESCVKVGNDSTDSFVRSARKPLRTPRIATSTPAVPERINGRTTLLARASCLRFLGHRSLLFCRADDGPKTRKSDTSGSNSGFRLMISPGGGPKPPPDHGLVAENAAIGRRS